MRSNDLADRAAVAQLQRGADKIGEIEIKLKRYLGSATGQNYHSIIKTPINAPLRKPIDPSFYRHPLSSETPVLRTSHIHSNDRLQSRLDHHMMYSYNLQPRDLNYHPSLQRPRFGLDNALENPLVKPSKTSLLNSSSMDLSLWRTKSQEKSFLVPPRMPTNTSTDTRTNISALNALSTSIETRKIKKLKPRHKSHRSISVKSVKKRKILKPCCTKKPSLCCCAKKIKKSLLPKCLRQHEDKENNFSFCAWPNRTKQTSCSRSKKSCRNANSSTCDSSNTNTRKRCLSGKRKPLLPCLG